jgi:hypothetical protein
MAVAEAVAGQVASQSANPEQFPQPGSVSNSQHSTAGNYESALPDANDMLETFDHECLTGS